MDKLNHPRSLDDNDKWAIEGGEGMFSQYVVTPTPSIVHLKFEDFADFGAIKKAIYDLYFSHDSISTVAHWIWEKDGCPDGEVIEGRFDMKVKDLHWWRAKMVLEVVYDTDIDTIKWCFYEWQDHQQNSGG